MKGDEGEDETKARSNLIKTSGLGSSTRLELQSWTPLYGSLCQGKQFSFLVGERERQAAGIGPGSSCSRVRMMKLQRRERGRERTISLLFSSSPDDYKDPGWIIDSDTRAQQQRLKGTTLDDDIREREREILMDVASNISMIQLRGFSFSLVDLCALLLLLLISQSGVSLLEESDRLTFLLKSPCSTEVPSVYPCISTSSFRRIYIYTRNNCNQITFPSLTRHPGKYHTLAGPQDFPPVSPHFLTSLLIGSRDVGHLPWGSRPNGKSKKENITQNGSTFLNKDYTCTFQDPVGKKKGRGCSIERTSVHSTVE